MKIHEAIVSYPSEGGLIAVDLPAMPADTTAVSGKIAHVMSAGPGEQPMVQAMPAKFKGVGVVGPGDGGGTWQAYFECDPPPAEMPPDGDVKAFIYTDW